MTHEKALKLIDLWEKQAEKAKSDKKRSELIHKANRLKRVLEFYKPLTPEGIEI